MASIYGSRVHLSGVPVDFGFEQYAAGDETMSVGGLRFNGACRAGADGFPAIVVAQVVRGRHTWRMGSEHGVGTVPWLMPPGRAFDVEFRDAVTLTLSLDPQAVLGIVQKITGTDSARLDFGGRVNELRTDPSYMAAVLRRLSADASLVRTVFSNPMLRAAELRTAVVALMETFPLVNQHQLPRAEGENALPTALRRAIAFLDDNAQQPITVDDVAAAARMSTRALQYQFRNRLAMTPTEYLRGARLAGAHRDLERGDPEQGDSVRTIALRWGFVHQGRFAQQHRDAYGELPRRTLER
jgi:AraC-like DNA-binding protein